jgi:hypothetical protein
MKTEVIYMGSFVKRLFAAVAMLIARVAVMALVIKFFDEISEFAGELKKKCPCCGRHDEFSDYVDEDEPQA